MPRILPFINSSKLATANTLCYQAAAYFPALVRFVKIHFLSSPKKLFTQLTTPQPIGAPTIPVASPVIENPTAVANNAPIPEGISSSSILSSLSSISNNSL